MKKEIIQVAAFFAVVFSILLIMRLAGANLKKQIMKTIYGHTKETFLTITALAIRGTRNIIEEMENGILQYDQNLFELYSKDLKRYEKELIEANPGAMTSEELKRAGFYKPYKDSTEKVDFMRYTNRCTSYGYNEISQEFYLCTSPVLESVIIEIIGTYKTFEEMREARTKYFLTEFNN